MKRSFLPQLAVVPMVFLLAACGDGPQQHPPKHPGGFTGPQHQSIDDTEDHSGHTESTEPSHNEGGETKPEQHATAPEPGPSAPAKVGNYDYGKAVPGKPGFVTSPYAPYAGYVDVRGYPPGTEVKDPYTGKTFLVP
jgi:predicted small lipoprotein YifL